MSLSWPLEFFVPGPLVNPMNGSHGHWSKHARWALQWRERTAFAWLATHGRGLLIAPELPKRVRFLAQTARTWDDDNLRPGMKPIRDGLMDLRLIHSDKPDSGHVFVYDQVICRQYRGVYVTVELLAPTPGGVTG